MAATFSFEIELELDGHVEPFRPATYFDPAEGGEVVDLEITDAGTLEYNSAKKTWKRVSFLAGVDLKNPEVQKLLSNLLDAVREDCEQAVITEDMETAA